VHRGGLHIKKASCGGDMIEARAVAKRYGGVVALQDASFSAQRGEVHALLGENGAGKSTFIQILTGLVQPDRGVITVDGAPFRAINPDAAQARGVAAVFQELSLIPDLTVEQNIWFRRAPLTRWGTVSRPELRAKTLALFRRYGFPVLDPARVLRSLTLAERQVVEIAKCLAKDPQIVILDEATSALPAAEADWLLSLTRQLAGEGRVVIFISHRMDEVRRVADRLTIFRNGETVAVHAAAQVSDDTIVTQMIGRQLDRLYPTRMSTATARPALRVRGLTGGTRLRQLDFDLFEGEVLGIGGLQGHGQRELFEALFGTIRSRGDVDVWGRPAPARSPRRSLVGREGIALVPEDRRGQGLLLAKSLRENLTLSVVRRFSRLGLLSTGTEAALAKEMLDRLRIKASSPEQLAGTLSGGNQQKVVFGKALLTEARVLLLYDPTRGVDIGTKSEIFALMRDLAQKGYAILFHSSDMAELVNVADRVIVMRDGMLAATLHGGTLTEKDMLQAALLKEYAA
jgi:ribose transport system ATP-binding protein